MVENLTPGNVMIATVTIASGDYFVAKQDIHHIRKIYHHSNIHKGDSLREYYLGLFTRSKIKTPVQFVCSPKPIPTQAVTTNVRVLKGLFIHPNIGDCRFHVTNLSYGKDVFLRSTPSANNDFYLVEIFKKANNEPYLKPIDMNAVCEVPLKSPS